MIPFCLAVLSLVAGIALILWACLGDGNGFHLLLGGGAIIAAYHLLALSL